jgi:hypothetical protein
VEKIKWSEKVTNEVLLEHIREKKMLLNNIQYPVKPIGSIIF